MQVELRSGKIDSPNQNQQNDWWNTNYSASEIEIDIK